jgi:hypothetical protein
MEYEFIFVDSSLVICRSFGAASVQDFVDSAEALTSDPGWRPGMDTITDHTHLDASRLTASDIEQIAGGESEYSDEIGQGRNAVVIGHYSPVTYGLARMFEAYIEPLTEATFRAFWTLDEALVWLRGPGYALPPGLREKLGRPGPVAKTESKSSAAKRPAGKGSKRNSVA